MKAKDLRQKSSEELQQMLNELVKEQFNLKMQKGTGQLSKSDQISKARKDIARIHTIMNEMARA